MIKTGQIFLLRPLESMFVCRDFENNIEYEDAVAICQDACEVIHCEFVTEIPESNIFCVVP